jgi:DNA repair protein RecO (recombination protein O)
MPKILRTEGIVLKAYNFRETSRIIALFSKDFGRLKLLAKGIRKPGSRFGGTLELFTHSSIIFYRRESREIHTLSDSQILYSFDKLRSELTSFTLASKALNFLAAATPDEEPHPELFRFTLSAFKLLEKEPTKTFVWGYLMKALGELGYSPELARCVECGKPSSSTVFSIERGGIVCSGCTTGGVELNLSEESLSTLRVAQESDLQRLMKLKIPTAQEAEIDRFLSQFVRYHLNLDVSLGDSWLFK